MVHVKPFGSKKIMAVDLVETSFLFQGLLCVLAVPVKDRKRRRKKNYPHALLNFGKTIEFDLV
jgi:hypothetical protein